MTQVPEESFGGFGVVEDASGEGRQEGNDVVTATDAEFLAHLGRPVLRSDFPTVDVRADQRLVRSRERFVSLDESTHEVPEMDGGRFFAELVAFEAASGCGRGMVVLASGGVAEAEDQPFAGRGRRPIEPAFLVHLLCYFDDLVTRNGGPGRSLRKGCGQGRKVLPTESTRLRRPFTAK